MLSETPNRSEKVIVRQNYLLIFLSFIIVALTIFIINQNSSTDQTLKNILSAVWEPKPYLTLDSKCEILSSKDVKELFDTNVTGDIYYADKLSLKAQLNYASQPFMKITIPSSIKYIDVISKPSTDFIETEEKTSYAPEQINRIISASWTFNMAPDQKNIEIYVLYEKSQGDNLKQFNRQIIYGSKETGQSYSSLNCYSPVVHQ